MLVDIFDIDDIESIIRKHWAENGVIDLKKFNIPHYAIPSDYEVKELHLPAIDYDAEIKSDIKRILKTAEDNGFNREKLFTPIFEACRNAHQHGNQHNPYKKVIIGYKIVPGSLDIAIIDEGGKLDPEFASFVMRHRQGLHRTKYVNFYTFSNKSPAGDHQGAGTTLIHSYVDAVKYYKSKDNGLVVNLIKRK